MCSYFGLFLLQSSVYSFFIISHGPHPFVRAHTPARRQIYKQLTHASMDSDTDPIWLTFRSKQLQAFFSTATLILQFKGKGKKDEENLSLLILRSKYHPRPANNLSNRKDKRKILASTGLKAMTGCTTLRYHALHVAPAFLHTLEF